MQEISIIGTLDSINFAPSSTYEEIIQNIKTILTTNTYSVPLDRGFGVAGDYVDMPIPLAKAKLASYVVAAINKYEPRVEVTQVTFDGDGMSGKLIPTVKIRILQ